MKDPCSQMLTSVRMFFVADLNLFTAFHLFFVFFFQQNILNGMVINASFKKLHYVSGMRFFKWKINRK